MADDSHEMSSLTSQKNNKKNISNGVCWVGALRVNLSFSFSVKIIYMYGKNRSTVEHVTKILNFQSDLHKSAKHYQWQTLPYLL